jgi:hypothetical protein
VETLLMAKPIQPFMAHRPIYNSSVSASHPDYKYGLRELLRAAWKHLGVEYNPDANAGSPIGLAELTENWHKGKRQIATEAYRVFQKEGITVLTETAIAPVLIDDSEGERPRARGVEVIGGQKFLASKRCYHLGATNPATVGYRPSR